MYIWLNIVLCFGVHTGSAGYASTTAATQCLLVNYIGKYK